MALPRALYILRPLLVLEDSEDSSLYPFVPDSGDSSHYPRYPLDSKDSSCYPYYPQCALYSVLSFRTVLRGGHSAAPYSVPHCSRTVRPIVTVSRALGTLEPVVPRT